MPQFMRRWQIVLAGATVGALLAVAGAAGGLPADRAASAFAVVFAYSLVIAALQGRSETMSTLAGRPVDERWQLISDRATSITALVGVVVALGGYVVAEATGGDSLGFGVVAAAMGAAYLVGVAWYRWRL